MSAGITFGINIKKPEGFSKRLLTPNWQAVEATALLKQSEFKSEFSTAIIPVGCPRCIFST
jgi:hypothetical protein